MFENLREILLCSSGDSPRRHPNSSKLRRRPGEIISSQGIARPVTPHHVLSAAAADAPWNHHCRSVKSVRPQQLRTPSPVQRHWGTPGGCRSPAASVREAFGHSLTYSGAAAIPEDELPGRGLYVSMQRGLGARGTSRPGGLCNRSPFSSSGAPSASSRSSQRYTSVAASYEALPDDSIDQLVEKHARLLPADPAKVLVLRRQGHGEYEVDGCRVHIAWRGSEACVFPLGDASQREAGEPLISFLWRAADAAHARQMARSCSDLALSRAPLLAPCGTPSSGSFLLNSDGSSFLISRDSGSFCGVWMPDDWNEGPHTMRVAAGARSPLRAVGSSTPSTSYRTDSQPGVPLHHQVMPHALMGISTPTLPAARISPPRTFALGQPTQRMPTAA